MENKKIKFALRSICTDEFAIMEAPSIEGKKIQLEHSFTFSLNTEADALAVSFKIIFKAETEPFIILRVTCVFEIKADDLVVSKANEPKKIKLPKEFMRHLAFLTTGTARGVLHSKLEKTEFNKYLLPVMDITKAFETDAFIEPKELKKDAATSS